MEEIPFFSEVSADLFLFWGVVGLITWRFWIEFQV